MATWFDLMLHRTRVSIQKSLPKIQTVSLISPENKTFWVGSGAHPRPDSVVSVGFR